MAGLEMLPEHALPRPRDRRHHAVGTDGDHAIDLAERDRRLSQRARCIRVERGHDIANERFVLRALSTKAWRFVAAPHDGVGCSLDLLDLVAIDGTLVPGEVEHAAAICAQGLPDREQDRVAESAADEQHAFTAGRFGRVTGRTHENDRLPWGKLRAQV